VKKSKVVWGRLAFILMLLSLLLTRCGDKDSGSPSSSAEPEREYAFDVRNKSSVVVTVTFNGTVNYTLPVNPNWKTSVVLSKPLTSIFFTPDTVRYEYGEREGNRERDITFYDR